MKKILCLAAVAAIAASLQGCASDGLLSNVGKYETGEYVTPQTMASLVDNHSTKKDVIAQVGEPARKADVSGREVWYYDYSKLTSFAGNTHETTAFEFNRRGVLVSHYKSQGTGGHSSNALLKAAGE